MDVKNTQNNSTSSIIGDKPEAESESVLYYIAVKGSLHAFNCAVFGLKEEEVKALESKYPRSIIVNGVAFKTNVLNAVNSLVQLGYKVLSSTGETEITWTMQREV